MKIRKIPQAYEFRIELTYDEYTALLQSKQHLMMHAFDQDETSKELFTNLAPVIKFLEAIQHSKARH